MSLKAIHILFLSACAMLSLGCSLWAYGQFGATGSAGYLLVSFLCLAAAPALAFYGRRFLQKLSGMPSI